MRGEYFRLLSARSEPLELPPRARRIQSCQVNIPIGNGTTSACAENTSLEDTNTYIGLELPPRARRIPPFWPGMRGGSGTTSACAENTFTKQLDGIMIRNYLRVRGEYYIYRNLASGGGNYLRVRGEYEDAGIGALSALELPPRARRILHQINPYTGEIGTTSACAENTVGGVVIMESSGNYLRVRGEYFRIHSTILVVLELPPRARRILNLGGLCRAFTGTTSACAENTWGKNLLMPLAGNYLRVRGEYVTERTFSP